MQPVAVFDIGTNTVRVLVAEQAGSGMIRTIHRNEVITRLGEGVDEARMLAPEPQRRTVAALGRFSEEARAAGAGSGLVVATSAVRDARNRDDFVALAGDAAGFPIVVLSGEEEAEASFRGAGLMEGPEPRLVVDIGGGSTELTLGPEPWFSVSVDIGSVRLTERTLPDRPAPPEELDVARREVGYVLGELSLPAEPGLVIGVAGTFTTLAAVAGGSSAGTADVHGAVLSAAAISALVERFAALTVEETAKIPGVATGRAPVILAGAVIGEVIAAHLGLDAITISTHDLLAGVALNLLEG